MTAMSGTQPELELMHPVLAREIHEHAENQGVSVATSIRRAVLGYLNEHASVEERITRLEQAILTDDETEDLS